MLVPYCDVHLKTAAPLTAYCYTTNCNVLIQIQVTVSKFPNLISCIYLDNVISKRPSKGLTYKTVSQWTKCNVRKRGVAELLWFSAAVSVGVWLPHYEYHNPLLQGSQYASHPSSTGCSGARRRPHALRRCTRLLCQFTQALRQLGSLVEPCVQASEQGAVAHSFPPTTTLFSRLQLPANS
jgi:hypothetical protein